jgi:hypothetical protein
MINDTNSHLSSVQQFNKGTKYFSTSPEFPTSIPEFTTGRAVKSAPVQQKGLFVEKSLLLLGFLFEEVFEFFLGFSTGLFRVLLGESLGLAIEVGTRLVQIWVEFTVGLADWNLTSVHVIFWIVVLLEVLVFW